MREKPVQQHRVDKYIEFLQVIKSYSDPYNNLGYTISQHIKSSGINTSISKALFHFKLIKGTCAKWEWISRDPDRLMVLEILDYLLHLNKKTQHTPLMPDFATSIDGLNKATEAMVKATDNLHLAICKVISGGHKNTPMLNRALQQADMSETIFSEHERNIRDRVYLAGQIANNVFNKETIWLDDEDIKKITIQISKISGTIINHLNEI